MSARTTLNATNIAVARLIKSAVEDLAAHGGDTPEDVGVEKSVVIHHGTDETTVTALLQRRHDLQPPALEIFQEGPPIDLLPLAQFLRQSLSGVCIVQHDDKLGEPITRVTAAFQNDTGEPYPFSELKNAMGSLGGKPSPSDVKVSYTLQGPNFPQFISGR